MFLGAFAIASYERKEIFATLGSDVLVLVCSRCTQRELKPQTTKAELFLLLLSVHKCETGATMDKNLPWEYVL